jgi:hypothetical protein
VKCSLCDGEGKVVPDAEVVLIVKGVRRPKRFLKAVGTCECWACKGKGTVELGPNTAEPPQEPAPPPEPQEPPAAPEPAQRAPEPDLLALAMGTSV